MSAERVLIDAYREWRRLAHASRKAIRQKNWPFLLKCQSAVREIQSLTAIATRQVRDEWSHSGADCTAKKKELHDLILELKALVESNKRLLQAARETALCKREQIQKAGHNLKRIQESYGSARPPARTRM